MDITEIYIAIATAEIVSDVDRQMDLDARFLYRCDFTLPQDVKLSEIFVWLNDNFGVIQEEWMYFSREFYFKSERQKILFMLRWS